ncbi:hypothetical protein IFM89_036835 [Coptis chinensis]|uniref:CCHC-type domain-containing protein n=1 Tax=Coptis chinensis TaxID=261450 RepID=A0A835LKJ3_9MAGN|nr:hypothetical protein IFM89_036835 [Coptis chinensis]
MKNLTTFEKALIGSSTGGMAGAFTYVCLLPLDTIKTKLQTKGATQIYKGSVDVIVKTFQAKGILGFYSGISAIIVGSTVSSAIYFGTCEFGKLFLSKFSKYPSVLIPPTAGAMGNIVSSAVMVPKKLITQRMQASVCATQVGRYLVTMMSIGVILATGFQLSDMVRPSRGIRQLQGITFDDASGGEGRSTYSISRHGAYRFTSERKTFDCNCKRPGHYAREWPNVAVCNNCGVPGHIAAECSTKSLCWNCRKAATWPMTTKMRGYAILACPKSEYVGERGGGVRDSGYRDIVCQSCHQVGHMSRDCTGGLMICHNCGGCGHMAYECLSGKFMERAPRRYRHFPRRRLWAVMVDLLGRAGHLEEALNLAVTMPIETCGEHSLVLVGSMEILIREKGLRKNPRCNLMEAEDGIIHKLFAGDITHPKSKEIKEALEELLQTSFGLLTMIFGTPLGL